MRAGGSKQKGAAFEREVCCDLSLWASAGKYEDVFWRSAMSGGRATLAQRKGKRLDAQSGDISSIRPEGAALTKRFVIECKFYKDLNLGGLFNGERTRGINEFWRTLIFSIPDLGKRHPLLIAKENRREPLVMLDQRGTLLLGISGFEVAIFPDHDASIYFLKDFLLYAKYPTSIRLNLRSRKK